MTTTPPPSVDAAISTYLREEAMRAQRFRQEAEAARAQQKREEKARLREERSARKAADQMHKLATLHQPAQPLSDRRRKPPKPRKPDRASPPRQFRPVPDIKPSPYYLRQPPRDYLPEAEESPFLDNQHTWPSFMLGMGWVEALAVATAALILYKLVFT